MSKRCDNCTRKDEVFSDENEILTIPYVAHQSAAARQERQIRRMWIALIVAISMLFASNIGWLIYESQFETFEYSYDYQQDGNGNNIIGNDNEVDYNGAETSAKN